MKWFKHQCNARDDEGLIQVRAEFGMAGYGRYFAMLEAVAGRSRNDCFELTLPTREWCSILDMRPGQLRVFLEKCAELGLNSYSTRKELVTIGVPKLAKYRDEYSRKSGHTPDNVAPEAESEPDTDTESLSNQPSPEQPARAHAEAGEDGSAGDQNPGDEKAPRPKRSAATQLALDRVRDLIGKHRHAVDRALDQDAASAIAIRALGGWDAFAEKMRSAPELTGKAFCEQFGKTCAAKSKQPRGSPKPAAAASP